MCYNYVLLITFHIISDFSKNFEKKNVLARYNIHTFRHKMKLVLDKASKHVHLHLYLPYYVIKRQFCDVCYFSCVYTTRSNINKNN